MPATSPAQALGLTLHGPKDPNNPSQVRSNSDIVLLDYRDPATFIALWLECLESGKWSRKMEGAENEEQIDLTDSTKQFLLIGNDPPDGIFDTSIPALAGINFRSHFTATSWLAAWKVKFSPTDEEQKMGAVEINTRFAVIDPRDPRHAQGAARALQTILCARDTNGKSLVPGATVLNNPSLGAICQWLKPIEHDNRTVSKDAFHLRDLLKSTIWNELTSERERHHALSNVLGAFLLPFQAAPWETPELLDILKKEHPVAPFLLELVNACGGAAHVDKVVAEESDETGEDSEIAIEPDWWLTDKQCNEFSSAVLIDDMSDIWGLFVQLALGFVGSKRQNLLTIPKDNFRSRMSTLSDRLNRVIDKDESLKASDLIGDAHHNESNFVLFLDLRLELGSEFQAQLEKLGNKLLSSNRNLPWLTEDGRRNFQAELDSGKTNETLLPRLVALIDPTLPIIIFSSTHRSELIDPFRDYANIIVNFRKPVLSGLGGDWQEMIRSLRKDFAAAMNRAAAIEETRQKLSGICRKARRAQSDVGLPPSNNGWMVEIFFDESEEPTHFDPPRAVCAGGLVLVRTLKGNGAPIVSDEELFDRLAEVGCIWGWCSATPSGFPRPVNSPQTRNLMPKGTELKFGGNSEGPRILEHMISSIKAVLGTNGSVFPFAAIDARSRPLPNWLNRPSRVPSWLVEKVCDATLRELMQHSLEVMLFKSESLRLALAHPKSRLAIDFGIRDYPCQSDRNLFEAFGFEVRNGWRPSLNSEDGYSIVSDTISRTGIPWPYGSKIERARAIALRDFGNNPAFPQGVMPRQLHYLADTISHVALDDLEEAVGGSEEVRQFFASGWICDFRDDSEEKDRLEIGRVWDQGDRIASLRGAFKLELPPNRNGMGIDLFEDLDAGVRRLSGEDLSVLFALAQEEGKKKH